MAPQQVLQKTSQEMLANKVPNPVKLPLSRKTEALLCAETAKIITKQPPSFPESPIRMMGMQQKMPEEIKTSEKFKSKMDAAL